MQREALRKEISPSDYTKSRIAEIRSKLYSQHCAPTSARKYQLNDPRHENEIASYRKDAKFDKENAYREFQSKQFCSKEIKSTEFLLKEKETNKMQYLQSKQVRQPQNKEKRKIPQKTTQSAPKEDEKMFNRRKERREGRSVGDMCSNRVKQIDKMNSKIKEILNNKREFSSNVTTAYSSVSNAETIQKKQNTNIESLPQKEINSLLKMHNCQSIELINIKSYRKHQSPVQLKINAFDIQNFMQANQNDVKFKRKQPQQQKYQQKSQNQLYPQINILPATNKLKNRASAKKQESGTSLRLANTLSHMLQIDRKLRKAREEYSLCKTANKSEMLQKAYQQLKSMKQNSKEWPHSQVFLQLIEIGSEQHDPFANQNIQKELTSFAQLIQTFEASHSYFECSLRGCINGSSFSSSQLDMSKKGYLSMEDLVCFINLWTGNCYRNRDVGMLWKRLAINKTNETAKEGMQQLTYQAMDKIILFKNQAGHQ